MTTPAAQLFSDILAAYLEDLSESQAQALESQHQPQSKPSGFTSPLLSLARLKARRSGSTTPTTTAETTTSSMDITNYVVSQLLRKPPLPLSRPIASMDYFCAEAEPPISYQKYVQRLLQYFRCSPECFVLLVVYLRRAVYDKAIFVNSKNVHRLCLVGLLLAVKQREDIYYSMKYYASVGGVQVRDLMDMELKFFADVLNYRGHVDEEEYRAALEAMTASWNVRQYGVDSGAPFLSAAKQNPFTSSLRSPTSGARVVVPPTFLSSSHPQQQQQLHTAATTAHPCYPVGKGMPSRVGSCATSCGLSGMSSPVSEALDFVAPPTWVVECGLYW